MSPVRSRLCPFPHPTEDSSDCESGCGTRWRRGRETREERPGVSSARGCGPGRATQVEADHPGLIDIRIIWIPGMSRPLAPPVGPTSVGLKSFGVFPFGPTVVGPTGRGNAQLSPGIRIRCPLSAVKLSRGESTADGTGRRPRREMPEYAQGGACREDRPPSSTASRAPQASS